MLCEKDERMRSRVTLISGQGGVVHRSDTLHQGQVIEEIRPNCGDDGVWMLFTEIRCEGGRQSGKRADIKLLVASVCVSVPVEHS